MDCFKAHGDFDCALDKIAKAQSFFTDKARMGFDDDVICEGNRFSDGLMIGDGNCRRIKEAAAVIEFYLFWFCSQLVERERNLAWDRTFGNGFSESVFPEVAHEAAPWAFLVSEKNGRGGNDPAGVDPFFFQEKGVRFEWVEMERPGRAKRGDLRRFQPSCRRRGILCDTLIRDWGGVREGARRERRRVESDVLEIPACRGR